MSIWNKVVGDPDVKYVKSLQPMVEKINALEPETQKLSDEDLAKKTEEFKRRLQGKETLNDLLPEAFAVVREAALRTLKMRHFDVQLVGGIVLHNGRVAEMKTGEGKTLVATLPVYLNALAGKGVHVVTVNEYLATRDAEWMGEVYRFLGMTVGVAQSDMDPEEKREAYRADVIYGTNNEFGFDYLRDNMAGDMHVQVQRGLHYTIIDEVDSVLIDEARTPLIISAPDDRGTSDYEKYARLVPKLEEGKDYNIDEKMKASTLTDAGMKNIEKLLGVENIYQEKGIMTVHHIEQALRAHTLFHRDKSYVVRDGEVVIIDEFTGRMLAGRRYSEGLHQAIEAKEGVSVQKHSRTMATTTFQNYFRLYKKLSGMTGTAKTEEEEFQQIYGLDVTSVPTNKPVARADHADRIYRTERGKFQAVIREAQERHEKKQPVLIGTVSVEKNERLSQLLTAAGLEHEVLNAKNHEREAEIVENAGRPGAITLATNMAGRGVDIALGGGDASEEDKELVKQLGGLFVLGTERHESRRIDNQLRGRSGRQGDPGESRFFVSAEDDLLRIFGSDRMRSIMGTLKVPEDEPIEHKLISRSLQTAQKRVEGANFDTRKHVLKYDDVMSKHREVIYARRQGILESWERIKHENDLGAPDEEPLLSEEQLESTLTLRDRVFELFEKEIDNVVGRHTTGDENEDWNTEEIAETLTTVCRVPKDLRSKLDEIKAHPHRGKEGAQCRTEIIELIMGIITKQYDAKEQEISAEMMRQAERMVLLRSIDMLWVDHLDEMSELREGIGLRGYGQKDPLVEYKKEGFGMFQHLLESVQKQVVYSIFKVGVARRQQASPMETERNRMSTNAPDDDSGSNKPKPARKKTELGRNDPCHCGSGKKYKKCHGA